MAAGITSPSGGSGLGAPPRGPGLPRVPGARPTGYGKQTATTANPKLGPILGRYYRPPTSPAGPKYGPAGSPPPQGSEGNPGLGPHAPPHPPGTAPGTTPGSGSQGPGTTPGSAPSPYDATYFAQVNNATFNANNKINGLDLSNAYQGTALENALAQLQYQNSLADTKAQNAENARGGFAQGALGQTLSETNRAYLDKGSGDVLSEEQKVAANNAAIAAIQGGLPLEIAAYAAASAARATKLAAANKALGAPPAGKGGKGGVPGSAPGGNARGGQGVDQATNVLTYTPRGSSGGANLHSGPRGKGSTRSPSGGAGY